MEKSGLFSSNNGDRKYKAEDFAAFFNSFITNGVFPNPSTNLQVIANNNMTVTVIAGKAWINGYCYINDSDLILPIDVADGVLNRIDRIAIRMDTTGRAINTIVKKGAFASSPAAPTLQRDADGYELGIADIYIGKGVTSIVQANITDQRMNTSLSGWVNSLIQADTTAIFNQYLDWYNTKTGQYQTDMAAMEAQFQSDFTTWFNGIKGQLSGDIAANLASQIADINTKLGTAALNTTAKDLCGAVNELKAKDDTFTSTLADIPKFQTAGGTATAITLTGITLTDGFSKTFIASADNSGSVTTINGKNLYKPNTTNAPTLKAGKAYTIWYKQASDCFFIKASATGTTTPDKVLAGETYSTEVDTDQIGTMPNKGSIAQTITTETTLDSGYYTGGVVSPPRIKVPYTINSKYPIFCALDKDLNNYYLYSSAGYHGVKYDKNGTLIADIVDASSGACFANEDGVSMTVSNKCVLRDWNGTIIASSASTLTTSSYQIVFKNNKYYASQGTLSFKVYDSNFTLLKTITNFTQNVSLFGLVTRSDKYIIAVNTQYASNAYNDGTFYIDTINDTATLFSSSEVSFQRLGAIVWGF